jgi:hypothetical protein
VPLIPVSATRDLLPSVSNRQHESSGPGIATELADLPFMGSVFVRHQQGLADRDAQKGWRCSSHPKSGMTDAEKLKATDVVAGSMLAVAKLELAAMAQTKQALY